MLQKMHMIFKLQNSKLRNRFFPSGNRQNIYCREFSTGQAKKLRKRPGASLADRPFSGWARKDLTFWWRMRQCTH